MRSWFILSTKRFCAVGAKYPSAERASLDSPLFDAKQRSSSSRIGVEAALK